MSEMAWMGSLRRLRTRPYSCAQAKARTVELADLTRKFLDFDVLILGNVREMLAGVGRGPPHVDCYNVCIVSQADVLLHRL